jgi:uncharacterized protein YdeI (YjbR/CyaY-like superfamily)
MNVTYFKSAADFREWLQCNHATVSELRIGFYKKDSGKLGISYPEALDQALCFGWIDGVRKRVDDISYTIRFTPRTARSIWSVVNTRRVKQLRALGRMAEAGLKAFAGRDPQRTRMYSFERRARLSGDAKTKFKANKRAWAFFQAQPPGYQRLMTHWVTSAKREETRAGRLDRLIAASAKQCRIDMLTGKPEKGP